MGPPPTPQHTVGRPMDPNSQNVPPGSARENFPFGQNSQGGAQQTGNQYGNQLGVGNAQGGNYRGQAQQSPLPSQSGTEHGRAGTPPPSRSRDDLTNLDVSQLVSRHDELRE